jgi:hypothetical protein
MKKEDVAVIAKLLTNMKNSLDELDSALKKRDSVGADIAKRKILELQVQINRLL